VVQADQVVLVAPGERALVMHAPWAMGWQVVQVMVVRVARVVAAVRAVPELALA
jgi:hypothetical protein